MCPGGVFVIEGSVLQAAMEDADEPVGECSEGLVVGVLVGSSLVVERSAAGAGGERAERPSYGSVVEMVVADVSGGDRLCLP